MIYSHRITYLQCIAVTTALIVCLYPAEVPAQSTRITSPDFHARQGPKAYPFREKEAYILQELDLRLGDVVADIGAGDGWWTERLARVVGPSGTVYATEVDSAKVEKLHQKYADTPQIKPCLTATNGTGLPENSCDMVLMSMVYHHLDKNVEVGYLQHLAAVANPTGRLCIIEKDPFLDAQQKEHATYLSQLIKQAEEAGWVPVRIELMRGTYHYLAIFVQRSMFAPDQQ